MLNFQKMMKQAQEMQFRLQEVQEKLKDLEVTAESGGGLIKVRMACSGRLAGIDIDPSLMETDKETLEDLIIAAINQANEAKDERVKTETQRILKDLGLPGDMNLPF